MDDGESEGGSSRLELSLSLGFPFLPRRLRSDLGSEIAFNLLPFSPFAEETISSSSIASDALAASFLDAELSPSIALNPPDLVPFGPLLAAEGTQDSLFSPSYSPLSPSLVYSPRSPAFNYGTRQAPEIRIRDSPYIHSYVRINEDSHRSNAPDNHSALLGVHDNPLTPSDHFSIARPVVSPLIRIPHRQNERNAPDPPYSVVRISELTNSRNGASSRQELREFPEFRIQRLIELASTRLARNFNPSPTSEGQASDPEADTLTCPERLMHNILRSRRSLDAARRSKVDADCKKTDGSDDMLETAVNFECNICYDMAKDPVVTPCGHLFCWPCIYQWLYAHSKHSECPVCKGQVLEINVTPIYGHGSSVNTEKKDGQDEVSNMKIPPRPHAHRVECFSQQLNRPIVSAVGVVQEVEGSSSNSNTGVRSSGTRSRARVIPRDELSGANLAAFDFELNAGSNSQNDNFPGLRQRSRRSTNLTALATSSPDSQLSGLTLRRRNGVRIRFAVLDSTETAVIHGDHTSGDAATGSRMAGSSSTSVIRERSNTGSLDSDEEFAQTYSRRRLN